MYLNTHNYAPLNLHVLYKTTPESRKPPIVRTLQAIPVVMVSIIIINSLRFTVLYILCVYL